MIRHAPPPRNPWPDPCGYTIIKWLGVAVVAGVCLWLGLAQGNAATRPTNLPASGAHVTTASESSGVVIPTAQVDEPAYLLEMARAAVGRGEYRGPFTPMQVPSACSTPQANLRYYNDQAPAGTAFLRSGAHGHGGYLRCIYFYVDGPLTGSDHHYGKWLVFTADGRGLLIGQDGIEASYVNCALPGYHFPFPVGNGQPNDCGESWVTGEGQAYVYQDNTAGDLGKPMFPATLP